MHDKYCDRMQAWNVYLKGRLINTVFYDKYCDRDYVKNSLVNHDGYSQKIYVEKEK